jgi:tetratricopeptide (TPR) repeat protein
VIHGGGWQHDDRLQLPALNQYLAARGYAVAAEIFRDLGENARALELYELAVDTVPTEDRHLGDMYRAIGEIHEAVGRPAEALESFKRALDVRTHVRHG